MPCRSVFHRPPGVCTPVSYNTHPNTQTTLTCNRGKYNIKRTIDGRVQLRRKSGAWMSVRLDMEVPGAILLRDMKTEAIYALETDGLPQVCGVGVGGGVK